MTSIHSSLPSEPIVPRAWIALTAPIALTMGIASAVGVFTGAAYVKETASWAAQAIGQDIVNLFMVCPALLIAGHQARAGSPRALLIWLGLLLYVVYSYVVYALCTHFSALFPVYVATLGLSFYALAGGLLTVEPAAIAALFGRGARTRAMSALLITVGTLFALLWLSDIGRALLRGTVPESVNEVGLPVNPIHVLDLAFALPGLIMTGILLRRRSVYGMLLAIPCGTFLVAIGLAIVSMWFVMKGRGVPAPIGLPIVITMATLISAYTTYDLLRQCGRRESGGDPASYEPAGRSSLNFSMR